jgi:hypothetical protein
MVNETVEDVTLEILAEKITQYAIEADDRTLVAAKLVREARKRVDAGEAGEITWYEWAPNNIELSQSRLRELQSIAAADDPKKELDRLRKKTRERVERHREKKASAPLRNGGATVAVTAKLEKGRKSLIEWAQTAPLDRIAKALSYIRQLDPEAADSDSNQPAEPAAA